MPQYIRNNAWNNGGTFDNPDLLWYAKGVGQMMKRDLNDPTSWWFYAAIHGEYVNPDTAWYPSPAAFPAWGYITAPPSLPTKPLPAPALQTLYWNQCQHGSWYFLPWHRGYLMALEIQLRHDIVAQGGPDTWALPYWNYFGGEGGSQFQMPPAFAQQTLPDGSPNPLYLTMRYGPDGDGDIYVPTAAGEAAHPNDPNLPPAANEVTEQPALSETQFSKADPLYGFGGPDTGFSHDGGHFGRLESNPHNKVHVYVGGAPSDSSIYGLMADPGTAALDPIFYLHHCNIDRLWGVWNAGGNENPTAPSWLDGPAQRFAMPDLNGQPWYYTPAMVTDLGALDYGYEELVAQPAAEPELATRLSALGAPAAALKAAAQPAAPRQPELLGANNGPLRIQAGGTQTVVKMDPRVRSQTAASLTQAAQTALPDKAFLKLENVRGTFDATVLRVFVQSPAAGADTNNALLADTVALFGLRRASASDGQHGGEGLTLVLDITHIIDQLHLAGGLTADALQVDIVPNRPLPEGGAVEVGRVSVYRQAL